MDLKQQKEVARQRIYSIEEAQAQSIVDIEILAAAYPLGISMYNQAEPWAYFVDATTNFTVEGSLDTFVLTGLLDGMLTAFNKDKSGFIKINPLSIPIEHAPIILKKLLAFLTPIEND